MIAIRPPWNTKVPRLLTPNGFHQLASQPMHWAVHQTNMMPAMIGAMKRMETSHHLPIFMPV